MAELKPIGKDQSTSDNPKFGFNFRGVDQVYDALMPLMAKHGVFSVPEVLDQRSEERKSSKGGNLIYRILTIKYTFYASDGSSVSAVVVGEGMDSGDKAANKAMSVGHKYAFFQVFCIATKEVEDPDREQHGSSEQIYEDRETQREVLCMHFRKYDVLDSSTRTRIVGLVMGQPYSKWESIVQENAK